MHLLENAIFTTISLPDRFGVPQDAVLVGSDINGDRIYAGLAYHADHWIPAKVLPAQGVAYIPYDCKEIAKHEYRVRNRNFLN